MRTTALSVSALALAGTLWASCASAGANLLPLFSSPFRVNGVVADSSSANREPFVVQLFSTGNECLRIAGLSQGADLEATLISPTGRIWQDDDGNGLNRPLIKAITDVRGFYTFQMSHFGAALVNAEFTVEILRVPSTLAQCAPATAPIAFTRPATAAAKSAQQAPAPVGGAGN